MPKKPKTDRKRLLTHLERVNEELEQLRNLMQGEVDVELDEGDTEIVEREKTAALIAVLERRQQDIEHACASLSWGNTASANAVGNRSSSAPGSKT